MKTIKRCANCGQLFKVGLIDHQHCACCDQTEAKCTIAESACKDCPNKQAENKRLNSNKYLFSTDELISLYQEQTVTFQELVTNDDSLMQESLRRLSNQMEEILGEKPNDIAFNQYYDFKNTALRDKIYQELTKHFSKHTMSLIDKVIRLSGGII